MARWRKQVLQRIGILLYRRPFSWRQALGYEWAIAPGVFRAVVPIAAPVAAAARVLDVGCGGGRLTAHLADRAAARIVGVDLAQSQVRRLARRRGPPAVRATADALPFRDGAFDAVVSSCAIKHWPDPVRGVRECCRVLRPHGELRVMELDRNATRSELKAFARTTRIPPGLRTLFIVLNMRAVLAVAPDRATLAGWLHEAFDEPRVEKLSGLPFLCAYA